MNVERLKNTLKRHEGYRGRIYKDTVGVLTIGYGRNLETVGITKAEADVLIANDIRDATRVAIALVPVFDELNDCRREVLVNMAYNLGAVRLRAFKKTLAAVNAFDFDVAADEMLDSRWARQVGDSEGPVVDEMPDPDDQRAKELSDAMRMGAWS